MEDRTVTDLNVVYKSVLEADKAAVVICDLDHTIIYMNPVAINRYEKWEGWLCKQECNFISNREWKDYKRNA